MLAQTFLNETAQITSAMDAVKMSDMALRLDGARAANRAVYFVGMGGSAANCIHAAGDFRKLCGIRVYTPFDNIAELTARANDEGWSGVFSNWLEFHHPIPGDILFVLSVGGGTDEVSVPITKALLRAKGCGMEVLGIVGRDGGATMKFGDCVLLVPDLFPERVTPYTEALQMVVIHYLVTALQTRRCKW